MLILRHTCHYPAIHKLRALAKVNKIHPVQGRAMIVTGRNSLQIFFPLRATPGVPFTARFHRRFGHPAQPTGFAAIEFDCLLGRM
jgi:hypothetical protein